MREKPRVGEFTKMCPGWDKSARDEVNCEGASTSSRGPNSERNEEDGSA